jgi:hypothetical protein
MKRLECE